MGKVDKNATETWWIASKDARAVVCRARKIAGKAPDVAKAENALHEAARLKRATLTESHVAIERAAAMAARLDQFMDSLKGTGRLKQFNLMFKRCRTEAISNGRGFMSYGNAMLRLRRQLIVLLQNGGKLEAGASLFAAVFGPK
jgi:hypothetical protein